MLDPRRLDSQQTPVAAAIAGIGMDLIYISRIQKSFERHGERFLKRILGAGEREKFERRYARDLHRGITFLATRFAAKEAFSKAVGLGIRSPMRWSAMQTLNAPSGKPMVVLSGELKQWYEARFGAAHVSLTDESDVAMALVIVERKV
ncbi:Holo-[acyl-carrier-protein] synthase [Oligella sp. MSHR50489EDL]|uniref:holo-ACP synthase n=1 Tax=Oligella sp. MSHR50489EDL TaxID=3139409 RepID=UPI003D81562C